MPSADQRAVATNFRDLHHDGILVLPCAWHAASARLFEEAGFPAVGTTSSGIAHAHGLPDGEHITAARMTAAVQEVTDAVSIPVTADIEAGYGATHEAVQETVAAVIDAGAVGINLEDGTGPRASPIVPVEDQTALIASIRETAEEHGVPLFVNARTDVVLNGIGPADTRLERAIDRSNRYLEAGADCAFVIGVTEGERVRALAEAIEGPVNVLANDPDTPSVAELAEVGVARVSVGGGPMHTAMAAVVQIAEELRANGTFSYLRDALPHGEMQARFRG